jgi:hypothetical protein
MYRNAAVLRVVRLRGLLLCESVNMVRFEASLLLRTRGPYRSQDLTPALHPSSDHLVCL